MEECEDIHYRGVEQFGSSSGSYPEGHVVQIPSPQPFAAVAQLVVHLICNQKVKSSSLFGGSSPTELKGGIVQ